MKKRLQLLLVLWGGLTLMACGNDDSQSADETLVDSGTESAPELSAETDQAVDTGEEPTAALLENPEALREAMRDPEQREALMQAMRERRQARREEGGEVDRGEMRERMRQRREQMMANRNPEEGDQRPRGRMNAQSDWWQDESMRETLALDDSQIQALDTRRETLETRKAEARQQLADSQRELMNALESVDRERISALIDQRSSAYQELQQAELDWWRTLLDQLNDEQLATLARQHPHLLR